MSLERLQGTVAPKVLLNAVRVSRQLTELGIPQALIGGLAVGIHGTPRATKDVDFLAGLDVDNTLRFLRAHAAELAPRFSELLERST